MQRTMWSALEQHQIGPRLRYGNPHGCDSLVSALGTAAEKREKNPTVSASVGVCDTCNQLNRNHRDGNRQSAPRKCNENPDKTAHICRLLAMQGSAGRCFDSHSPAAARARVCGRRPPSRLTKPTSRNASDARRVWPNQHTSQ